MGNVRTWHNKSIADIAQITDDSTYMNEAFWEGTATGFGVVKDIIDSANNRIPLDRDFTDLATALADSDVWNYGALLITKIHTITSGITLPVANFALIGAGRNTGIFMNQANEPLINIVSTNGCSIRNMRLYGTSAGTSEDGIKIQDSTDTMISGCWFDHLGGYAIRETGTSDYNNYTGCIMRETISTSPPLLIVGSHTGYGHFVGTAT